MKKKIPIPQTPIVLKAEDLRSHSQKKLKIINSLLQVFILKFKKINLKSFWIVRQYKNEYNPVHFHSGNISGVGYLKIPKNITKGTKRLKTNGTIDFIHGSKSFLSKVSVAVFSKNPGIPGNLTPFTLSNQKQAGQLMKASIRERLNS